MTKLSLIRFILTPQDSSPQAQVDLLRAHVIPVRQAIPHLSYASRQEPEIWLTVLAPEQECDLLERGARAGELAPGIERSSADPLLLPEAEGYRARLHETTSVAFDLLTGDGVAAHQRFLTFLEGARLRDRSGQHSGGRESCLPPSFEQGDALPDRVLFDYLLQHSSTYRGWSEDRQQDYRRDFRRPGPRDGMSYPGHWIWNLVVGYHPHAKSDLMAILWRVGAW